MKSQRIAVTGMFMILLLLSSISYSKESLKSLSFKGRINGSLNIHMVITPTETSAPDDGLFTFLYYDGVIRRYSGYYYYDKIAKKIRIDGYLYSNGYIWLTEFDEKNKKNGVFSGFIKDEKVIKGVWSNPGGKQYPFYLVDAKINPLTLDLNVAMDRVGCYERTDNNKYHAASLRILAEADHKIAFTMDSFWVDPTVKDACPNIGDIDGIAFYKDKSRTKAEFIQPIDKVRVAFRFSDQHIEVTGNDAFTHCGGLNAYMGGTFKKSRNYQWLNPFLK